LNFLGKWVSLWVTFTLFLTGIAPEGLAQEAVSKIDLEVVAGEGAAVNTGQRVAVVPSVRIVDQNKRPVRGAVVVFNLPVSGTSGEFQNRAKNLTVLTDENGTATATGLRANGIAGRLQILVTASYRGANTRGLINQTVQGIGSSTTQVSRGTSAGPSTAASGGGGHTGKWVAIIAVIGGAAAGGIIAATHKGGSSSGGGGGSTSSGSGPIGITPGTGTINPPH
jgi:glycine cleavage system H lipoate-binding protein